jgi:streptomycin 6-kinase
LTTQPVLPPLPGTCRRRLISHYGPAAEAWLDTVPGLLTDAGRRWNLRLTGYHDAGHASILAVGVDSHGRPVLVKAWFDPDRYVRETAALRLWHRGSGRVVLGTDDELSSALLRLIAARPGGQEPPPGETTLVADALQRVHGIGRNVTPGTYPSLADHLADELLPRMRERQFTSLYGSRIAQTATYLDGLAEDPVRRTVLHADLYRENVAFTRHGRPVLLDPLPMQGDALFDWAFWTIYYRLGHATEERLREASRRSGAPRASLLPWCLLIGLDGLLYYEDTGDPRRTRMADILTDLLASAAGRPAS